MFTIYFSPYDYTEFSAYAEAIEFVFTHKYVVTTYSAFDNDDVIVEVY